MRIYPKAAHLLKKTERSFKNSTFIQELNIYPKTEELSEN